MRDSSSVGQYLLATRFFTSRVLNMEAIARTFKLLWHTKKGFEVRDMGDHKVLFIFSEASDVDKVLLGEPWSFDKSPVALKKVQQHTDLKGLDFESASFWIQVHDLSLNSMTLGVAKDIVSTVGKVINCEADDKEYVGGNFMRVRVSIDLTKPLCRGQKLGLSNGDESWVSFKYERLPNVCYWCGRFTHHDKECFLWQKRKGTFKEEDQKFGSWLRANTPNFAKKTIVRVEGYEEGGDDNTRHESSHRWTESAGHVGLETGSDCNVQVDELSGQGNVGGDTVDNMSEHVEVQVGLRSATVNPKFVSSMDYLVPTKIVEEPSQVFQAQLDSIDEDLAQYDTVGEGGGCDLKAQSGGVGSKVVGSTKFLKNLFTQTEPCRNILRNSKPS